MCGIWGQIRSTRKRFDYSTFCTLGINNDSRGGDSCGIFIDGDVEYGVGKQNKFFENFMYESKLLNSITESKVALGHCRKASVGSVGIETAQPVVIYNETTKNPEFVVLHNGTIYNYKELARKYIPNVNIANMTDSQVMARIFYYTGFNVLSEYNGGSVFFIADLRNEEPEYYIWQGSSKKYTTSSSMEVERPFFMIVKPDELVFSSIQTFLPVLCDSDDVLIPNTNVLIKYKGGKLYTVKEIDRTKCIQSDQTKTTSYSYGSDYSKYYLGYAGGTAGYGSTMYGGGYSASNIQNKPSSTGNSVLTTSGSNITSGYITSNSFDGKCSVRNTLLQGKYYVNDIGRICENSEINSMECYFWNGTVLKNKECFDYLTSMAKDLDVTPSVIDEAYPELVLFLSPYPFYKDTDGTMRHVTDPVASYLFTGTAYFPFCATAFVCENGLEISKKIVGLSESLNLFKEHRGDKLDFSVLSLL